MDLYFGYSSNLVVLYHDGVVLEESFLHERCHERKILVSLDPINYQVVDISRETLVLHSGLDLLAGTFIGAFCMLAR